MIIVERASASLRGQLTRWLLEVKAGVFVGTVSKRVREKLWEVVCGRNSKGGSLMVYRARNEQGFILETDGDPSREIFENEGLLLVRRPLEKAKKAS